MIFKSTIPLPKRHSRRFIKAMSFLLLSSVLLSLMGQILIRYYPLDNISYRMQLVDRLKNTSSFSTFSDALFSYEVSSDSITKSYTLKNPENYQIPRLSPVLSTFSSHTYEQSLETQEHFISMLQDKLQDFSKDNLTDRDHFTLTLLNKTFSLQQDLTAYPYYEELLGPTSGVASNLPVTLGEYPIHNQSEADTYLQLIKQIPGYFDQIISYEKQRQKMGYTTPSFLRISAKDSLDTILDGFETDDNSFIDTFEERIAQIRELSVTEKEKLNRKNKKYVEKYIIPSYKKLRLFIQSEIKKDESQICEDKAYGLSTLPEGRTYYTLLIKEKTGSYRSINELIEMVDESLHNTLNQVRALALTNQEEYLYYCNNELESFYESPKHTLEALSLMIREDYPSLTHNPTYEIKNVSNSLAPSLSPAFYMIPPIDDYTNNTIYINPLFTSKEKGNLFTTLAHEGFPGHLYQTVFFNESDPHPLRQILNYPGYVEGWATYVELDSYNYLDYPNDSEVLKKLYQADTIINLAISSRIDLGVHYENWTLKNVEQYFEENGFKSYYAQNLLSYVLDNPANYLSYFIGYLELEQLEQEYREEKMNHFSEKEFHEKVLNAGPCDFETLKKYVFDKKI